MALEQIQDGAPPAGRALIRALREMQGLKVSIVAGAGANVNIPIAGLGADDTLLAVIEVTAPEEGAGTPALIDRTGVSAITSAGNIQATVATNTSAQRRLLVAWYDKTGL